jgi:excisionase family DNA binding protein
MFTGNESGGSKNNTDVPFRQPVTSVPASSTEATISFEHRLFTKREMADYFGITERTIEVWMRRRYIPYIKIGQSVRFRIATVLRYVDDKYLVPAGEPRRRCKIP